MRKYYIFSLFAVFLFMLSFNTASAQTFNTNLYWGINNKVEVTNLQKFLTKVGVYTGPISGNFYNLTYNAVKSFQKKYTINPVSGYFGTTTRAKANSLIVGNTTLSLVTPIASASRTATTSTSTSTRSGSSSTSVAATTTVTAPVVTVTTTTNTTTTVAPTAGEKRLTAYLTSYTYWDNTPPGSADISNPIIHKKAGGTGTYADPITLAVGHSITNGKDTLDFPAGTKFYIPYIRKYFIVEDTCGDGNTPQNGPCHNISTADKGAEVWLDMWIDGNAVSSSVADKCASALTANHLVIQNPASNYLVVPGSVISGTACAVQYGDTILTQ